MSAMDTKPVIFTLKLLRTNASKRENICRNFAIQFRLISYKQSISLIYKHKCEIPFLNNKAVYWNLPNRFFSFTNTQEDLDGNLRKKRHIDVARYEWDLSNVHHVWFILLIPSSIYKTFFPNITYRSPCMSIGYRYF